jgi:hypothetical protein
MNPDMTDTEFVHFEVLAERPRRRRARLPVALLALGVLAAACVAVMRLRAARARTPADVIPATELEARRAAAATADIPGC